MGCNSFIHRKQSWLDEGMDWTMCTIGSWNIMGRCASLVKAAQHNRDNNLTEREIDLAYGVKDKMASI